MITKNLSECLLKKVRRAVVLAGRVTKRAVYFERSDRAGLDDASVAELPEKIRVKANRVLPVYSKLTKIEVKTEPFEKTPKGSIKRFLYS